MTIDYIDDQEPIAIIGMACRLPGDTSSLGDLWDMISHARTGHGKVPADRWDADILHHPDPDRKGGISVKHGYFLQQDIGHFDAPFFSTTAKEAAAMDPMKRLLLEVSYESIENAGIPVEKLMNSPTGCYVGCMTNDYEMLSLRDMYDIGHTAASATSEAMTANRVSWFYGLKGPSLTLDTACSSSLYALHLACQSLRLGETNMSLVAGVNLLLFPNTMHQLSAMHMLSPEGISHTFDDRANGYGRGEGIACVVVKRLSDALRDGDTIRAVVRGTGANADGKTPSITQPSSQAQAELITSTYKTAGLDLTETQYFECHGTGTPVGDPIELEALASTFGAARAAAGLGPLYIGSIKPNVGHTEGCSGLAGIFKAVACLESGKLAPTYGVETINPKLKLADWNLTLPRETTRWPTRGQRRVSVNSFGFGGANAHAILDDAHHYLASRGLVGHHSTTTPEDDDGDDSESGISAGPATPISETELSTKRLFVFSSKDQAGLQRLAKSYGEALSKARVDGEEYKYLVNLAYTLSERRSHFDFRGFCVAPSLKALTSQLAKGLVKTKRSPRQKTNLVFVFTGQGAQWPAMGVELLRNPQFGESVQKSQVYLEDLGCRWNVVEELRKTDDSRINLPEFSQTLCTVVQVALVELLRCWGVHPRATVGHSSGEIAAAYAASYITHADAIKIAYVRGLRSAAVTKNGAMLAAGVSREEAQKYLAEVPPSSAVVACINSPSSITLSGDVESIDKLEKLISGDAKFARKLKVKTAYHSPHMETVAQSYLEKMGHIATVSGEGDGTPGGTERTFMYSSLTGGLVSPDDLSAQYWVSNMCAPVEFSTAVTSLLAHDHASGGKQKRKSHVAWDGFVEIGPHAALKGPVQQIMTASGNKTAKEAAYMSMLSRGEDATESSLAVAGKLWAMGHAVDLYNVNGHGRLSPSLPLKPLSDLPPYPWNHARRFWHEAYSTRSNRFPSAPRTDLLGVPVDMQNRFEPKWRNHLRISENPWIEDHQITGTTLYPAAGMLIMALEGAMQLRDTGRKLQGLRFRDVSFERGLVVPADEDGAVETSLSLLPDRDVVGQYGFTIFSTTNSTSWTRHCRGTATLEYAPPGKGEVEDPATRDLQWAKHTAIYNQLIGDASGEDVDVDAFYNHLQTIGMEYGPLFRNVVSLRALPSMKSSHGIVAIPDTRSAMPENFEYPHIMHPAAMDAIFHLLLAAFNDGRPVDEAAVPYSIGDMFVAVDQPHGAGGRFQGYGQLTYKSDDGHEIAGNLIVSDETWSGPKLTVKDFALRQVTSAHASKTTTDARDMKKCARVDWSREFPLIESLKDMADVLANLDAEEVKVPSEVFLLVPSVESRATSALVSTLTETLASLNITTSEKNLTTIDQENLIGTYIVSLLEVSSPLIYSWSAAEFASFKNIVSKADHLFWVTRGGLLENWAGGADFAPAQGLLRVLRNEYTLTRLPHLDLSAPFDLASPLNAELIAKVWLASLGPDAEMEFAESAGRIHVPRAVDEPGFDAELRLASGDPKPVETRLGDLSNKPLKLAVDPVSLKCRGDEDVAMRDAALGSEHVEIEVELVGLASRSCWARDAVGVVSRCGDQVRLLSVGQRVAVIHSEANKTKMRLHQSQAVPIPVGLSPLDASSLSFPFVSALYALRETASLRRGQSVLVNSAASDLGQAAVQVAGMIGARVFALVASRTEKEILTTKYGLSTSQIFDSNLETFIAAIDEATEGRGVDVIFNPRVNAATATSARIMGDFGYFLDLSSEGEASSGPAVCLPASKRNATLARVDMDRVIEHQPKVATTLLHQTFQDLARRQLITPPAPITTYSVQDLHKAVETLKTPETVSGRVVVSLDEDATILAMPPPAQPLVLEEDATYVLAGGLGALGLDIANMMVKHGAKHLVFLSRSGGSKNEKDLEGFRARGCQAEAFPCDVTDACSVATVFQALKSRGRTIKGIVQCAMVLEDTIFDNMTHEKWTRAFLPKTRGSRNLLAQLWPGDDPFFLLLSSITGIIGNTAQANYASGNTFEDALASHARAHLGIRATSIDVGLVSDSSHFTAAGEFGDLDHYLHRYQHGWTGLQTNLDELRVALTAVMRGATADGGRIPGQFVLGLGDKLVRKRGGTGFERDRKFDLRVVQVVVNEGARGGGVKEESVGEKLAAAATLAEAAAAVEASLKTQIAGSIGVGVDEVDVQRPLPDFGVDSLNAVEIRNRVLKEMQSEISVFELLSATPVTDLAVKIASRSGLVSSEARQDVQGGG
ncbi:ketoacyl-synt-domain-containing protein [Sodiomyces alkalinus F11]|uniref:Ketoacyl-synt-domain-containing protein n=1 Tax=Sodiomyces alkalinus (strain CBS 110278 / VKM F-3762 / F11) TaxID=1314773 RepID=A0A3N2PKJ9_SODAK|nr:ketoacyl-synt-domain-containing protein [Sodiomyces alkalinus F11]ROT35062.1 ketoacyl-synt-domain-containing protein [Sodiomyces alkalinus F11]